MVKRLRVLFMVVMCLGALLALAVPALAVHRPTHVMIVVMDQMQPGYAKQFAMTNVLSLQQHGVTFPNAYVGDMASETVVSHNVMVSGQFPKHMGWSDEAFRDVDNVLGFGANAIVTSGDLGYDQYVKLIDAWDYKKLGDYLHEKFPGTVVANVGEKGYQVESMAASSSDWYVRMGSKKKVADLADPSVVPWTGTYRGPSGKVPDYIKNDNRYLVSVGNATDTYGTEKAFPSWLYPEDGRYVGGPYDDHQSGDRWVADATLAIMDKENWSGLWVTFSAMDKIGHMWGGGAVDTLANYQWDPSTIVNQVHMQWIATNADAMLGALIAELKTKGIYDDTLIILTADHGSTYGKGEGFKGDDAYDAGNLKNWYAGAWHAGVSTESTSTGSVEPQAAHGHRQRRVQLPVHRHRDLAQGLEHGEEEGSCGSDGDPAQRDRDLREDRRSLQAVLAHDRHDRDAVLLVGGARPGARRHDVLGRLGGRGRPARRLHDLRCLRRPRRGADGRAEDPDGVLHAGDQARRRQQDRLPSGRHHADHPQGHGHRADRADGRLGVQAQAPQVTHGV